MKSILQTRLISIFPQQSRRLLPVANRSFLIGYQRRFVGDYTEDGTPSFPDTTNGLKGYKLAILRTSNIIKCMTEGQNALKLLNIHCNPELPNMLGKVSNIDITGCTDIDENAEICRKMKQYSDVDIVDFNQSLPYPEGRFHGIICLRPLKSSADYDISRPFPNLDSIAKSIIYTGFAIIGGCQEEIDRLQIFEKLEEVAEKYELDPVALQHIDCDIPNNEDSNSTAVNIDGQYVLVTLIKK